MQYSTTMMLSYWTDIVLLTKLTTRPSGVAIWRVVGVELSPQRAVAARDATPAPAIGNPRVTQAFTHNVAMTCQAKG